MKGTQQEHAPMQASQEGIQDSSGILGDEMPHVIPMDEKECSIEELIEKIKICCRNNNVNCHDPSEVDRFFRSLYEKFKDPGNMSGNCGIQFAAGCITLGYGFLYQSAYWFHEASESSRIAGNLVNEANSLGCLGMVKARMKCFGEAQSILQNAVDLAKKSKDRSCLVFQEVHLASLLYETAKTHPPESQDRKRLLASAAKILSRAICWARSAEDFIRAAAWTTNLGSVYELGGDVGSAIKCNQEAVEIYRKSKSLELVGQAYCSLGSLYQSVNRIRSARDAYQKAAESLGVVDPKLADAAMNQVNQLNAVLTRFN